MSSLVIVDVNLFLQNDLNYHEDYAHFAYSSALGFLTYASIFSEQAPNNL